jgi:hypothetical protein
MEGTEDVKLSVELVGMINGEILTAAGDGVGSLGTGRLTVGYSFSTIPEGYSVYCAALYTSCCSTPTFAVEVEGGLSMMSLSGGRYKCRRLFDFGPYGTYDYTYEIRLDSFSMRASGVIEGTLHLPELASLAEPDFTEIMVPVSSNEIRSWSQTSFRSMAGDVVPVRVEGRYTPLPDEEGSWKTGAQHQARSSYINVLRAETTAIELDYRTVVRGITTPVPLSGER